MVRSGEGSLDRGDLSSGTRTFSGRVPGEMERGDRDFLFFSRGGQQVLPAYASALSAGRPGTGQVPPPCHVSACPCILPGSCPGDRERNFPFVFRPGSERRTSSRANIFPMDEARGFPCHSQCSIVPPPLCRHYSPVRQSLLPPDRIILFRTWNPLE